MRRPRLGFLGVGRIGRNRLEALAQSAVAEIAVIADPSHEASAQAARVAPDAILADSFDRMLELGVDGIVIATPSALHAEQALAAIQYGIPVFCQKPLGRNAAEVSRVVDAAGAANCLLGVDWSYRFTDGMQKVRHLIRTGELGTIFAADLFFHNAHGPDKTWFYDRTLSGGGCVMDLGIHLVDLALWALDYPLVVDVSSRLFAQGRPLHAASATVEDYAVARLDLAGGAVVDMACSWKLNAGRDAAIGATFYGTRGSASFHNVDGSFYRFVAERWNGTVSQVLSQPPDAWSGRAAIAWARQLAAGEGFDREIERACDVAGILDAIYGIQ